MTLKLIVDLTMCVLHGIYAWMDSKKKRYETTNAGMYNQAYQHLQPAPIVLYKYTSTALIKLLIIHNAFNILSKIYKFVNAM